MTLADLRDGDRVFIDANIFIYHFGGRSLECKALLERCARRALLGYTSTLVLAEVLHRRMVAEAIAQELVTARTAVRKLGETPEMVKQLTQYQEDVRKIPHMHLTILPLTLEIVQASAEVRKSEELLTNDSFVVAFMREQGFIQLATANGDFDRVGGMQSTNRLILKKIPLRISAFDPRLPRRTAAQPGTGADALQRPLRSRFQARLTFGVVATRGRESYC
jgi:predicted nucleic acid-binding protein